MSGGEEDRMARSIALERTYVHDVYDQMSVIQYPDHKNTIPWPKIKTFLNDLEPGSIVCDVGCGSGKYLKLNPGVYMIGTDRCLKLTQMARDDDNEVLVCDNLTLPFRDESFDAVLSIAVIHHFASRERRICALKELARVLRIGGRLMVSVWAMEQKHRSFETQDVLVPWHYPQHLKSPSLEYLSSSSEEEYLSCRRVLSQPSPINELLDTQTQRSSSLKTEGKHDRSRLSLFQSLKSITTSPSSSTLSSPNETCYSFVRKALQKLSRSSKKEKRRSRKWFIDSWTTEYRDENIVSATRYEPEGCEEEHDIQNLPIEIRRMEKDFVEDYEKPASPQRFLQAYLPLKSKSLSDMLKIDTVPLIRSTSSTATTEIHETKITPPVLLKTESIKPPLVKQKRSICEELEEEDEDRDKPTDIRRLVRDLPSFRTPGEKSNVLKQQSLTEEIMSADRLREKEKIRQNIQKQTSLNEQYIYGRQEYAEEPKDTFSAATAKKFLMLKSGITNKFKSSTKSLEKVTGVSITSSFAKIFQNLTGGEMDEGQGPGSSQPPHSMRKSSSEDKSDFDYPEERRRSHEENSDSSKDNSLQSDTSIDSEDSVISVIERIPKTDSVITSPGSTTTSTAPLSPMLTQHGAFSGILSHPTSPKLSQSVTYQSKALSLPASPRTYVSSPNIKQTFRIPAAVQMSPTGKRIDRFSSNGFHFPRSGPTVISEEEEKPIPIKLSPITPASRSFSAKQMSSLSDKLSKLASQPEPRGDVCEGDVSLQPFDKEMSSSSETLKAGSPTALFKRQGSSSSTHSLRLSTLDLFNPETDDVDSSDSSGASTPESIGSVISVKLEDTPAADTSDKTEKKQIDEKPSVGVEPEAKIHPIEKGGEHPEHKLPIDRPLKSEGDSLRIKIRKEILACTNSRVLGTPRRHLPRPQRSLTEFRKVRPTDEKHKRRSLPLYSEITEEVQKSKLAIVEESKGGKMEDSLLSRSPIDETWHHDCRHFLHGFAEKLSVKLTNEINRYKVLSSSIEGSATTFPIPDEGDAYLSKLSEDLDHVSKLSQELSQEESRISHSRDIEASSQQDPEGDVLREEVEESIRKLVSSPSSEFADTSPVSMSGWLDSRRNTIECTLTGVKDPIIISTEDEKCKSDDGYHTARRPSMPLHAVMSPRRLSRSETTSHTRLSIESTEAMDMSERTASSEGSNSRRSTVPTETSSGISLESTSRTDSYEARLRSSQTSLRPGESLESSDTYDFSERTSDFSRQNTESRSVITQSSASLASWSDCSKDIRFADRRMARCDGRSSSEETNASRGAFLVRQKAATGVKDESIDTSLSGSTSQDSLTSEGGGGSLMFHRYYHVFRQGELDQMIDEYAENLHIISSYYDHSNWCVVAEKVRVWTI